MTAPFFEHVRRHFRIACQAPKLDAFVGAAGNQNVARRREERRQNGPFMPLERGDQIARLDAPELNCRVLATGRQSLTIW